jgi:hypothetical protein
MNAYIYIIIAHVILFSIRRLAAAAAAAYSRE